MKYLFIAEKCVAKSPKMPRCFAINKWPPGIVRQWRQCMPHNASSFMRSLQLPSIARKCTAPYPPRGRYNPWNVRIAARMGGEGANETPDTVRRDLRREINNPREVKNLRRIILVTHTPSRLISDTVLFKLNKITTEKSRSPHAKRLEGFVGISSTPRMATHVARILVGGEKGCRCRNSASDTTQ